ncbi:MAG: glycosyltransferase family 2 protein [Pseudomonadota bacterium]
MSNARMSPSANDLSRGWRREGLEDQARFPGGQGSGLALNLSAPSARVGLSVALICQDEALRLPAWLRAVATVADEIVAVDSGSRDGTLAILRGGGARVFQRAWSGYSDQRNFAESRCRGQLILFLDADERPDVGLCAALNRLKAAPPPSIAAWELSTKVHFFGRFLRHGGFFPEHKLRLYRRGQGHWVPRQVHEHLEVSGTVARLEGGFLEHYSYSTVGQYLRRLERYSAEAAREMHGAGLRRGGLAAISHAGWTFFNRYLLRLGFLDGFEGYLAARLEAIYTLAKYARLRELGRQGTGRGRAPGGR